MGLGLNIRALVFAESMVRNESLSI